MQAPSTAAGKAQKANIRTNLEFRGVGFRV